MAQTVDINHPPAGGFQNGGWYWDPQAKQARQYWNGSFGAPGVINNPTQQGYGQGVSSEVQKLSGYVGPTGSDTSSSNQNLSPLQQVNKSIQDSFQKLQDEVISKFGQYRSGKPFRVDEVLAEKTKTAAEQIDPYYNQLLGDYLLGVTTKINRGIDDTKDLLNELSASADSYKEAAKNSLDTAVEQAANGFADNGLFGSGDQITAEGKLVQNSNANMDDYTRKVGVQTKQLNTGLDRNIQDINLAKKDYVTNLEQNRFTDVNTRASQLTKEAGQDYVRGFQATLPAQLQSASGFDLLKTLGIYS